METSINCSFDVHVAPFFPRRSQSVVGLTRSGITPFDRHHLIGDEFIGSPRGD